MDNKRMCCFYLNKIHLVTMLLPYINERINENIDVITCFEDDLSNDAKRVISNIYGRNVKKLLKIDWESKSIEDILKLNFEKNLVIVSGKNEYMKFVNNVIKNEKTEILNCFEMMQGKMEFDKILENHAYVVNTSGESKIEDIFTKCPQKNYIT